MTNVRISTGTGLALLAGAITLHAVLPYAADRLEPSADAAWTGAFMPAPAPPQKAGGAPAAAPTGAPAVVPSIPYAVGLAAMPGTGTNTVLFRLWSNGHVDRRLTSSTNGLTWQGGWQPIWVQMGSTP
jgi:hypothetical protein